ncbi:App1 family protein [Marisediminicola senii]|uniref:App1 family protein n=1 Tax=Marisediminicola senii TaxID=2711233 RepID=UPI0013E9C36A|nr:phosphatase domain-containing protein [Marisediminicola senii]
MSSLSPALGRFRGTAITVAYRAENGIRDVLARVAVSRGWTPAAVPHSGYASDQHARVLGRIVLAPASVDPGASRGIPGWRRLLTLECPGAQVRIQLGDTTTTATSDAAGIIDTRVPLDSPLTPGTATVHFRVGERDEAAATIHVFSAAPVRGVICDIDDTVWITGLAHPLRAAWRTLRGSSSTRQIVPGMSRVITTAIDGQVDPGVVYLSNGPWNFAGPVARFLQRHDFPAGALLMTDWGITPKRWFRDGQDHKSTALRRLVEELPHISWVLVGDDGEHDPELYKDLANDHPAHVAVIALRQVLPPAGKGAVEVDSVNGVPVLHGADGDALLPLLREALRAES